MISISALRCWFSWNNLRGLKVSNGAKTLSYEAYAYRFRQGTCKNYPVPFFHPWYHRKLLPHSSLWKSLSHIGDVNYLQVNKTQTWQLSIQFQALLHIKVHISVELILYFKRRSTTKIQQIQKLHFKVTGESQVSQTLFAQLSSEKNNHAVLWRWWQCRLLALCQTRYRGAGGNIWLLPRLV